MESLLKRGRIAALYGEALNDDRIDVLATDHAPHTLAEKVILTPVPLGTSSATRSTCASYRGWSR